MQSKYSSPCQRQVKRINQPKVGLVDLSADRQARWIKNYIMFYIYAISSLHRNYIYVGMTKNLEERVERHNSGREKTTKSYRPFRLIYSEELDVDRPEARKREKYWKSGIGKEKLRIIRDNNLDLQD